MACLTALGAGVRGVFENDGKKVIALSTLSQLGFIIIAVSLNEVGIALGHLLMHALFKSILFICFGGIIMSRGHEQDLRRLGGGWDRIRVIASGAQISAAALCGLPFIRGYYSKDSILELVTRFGVRGVVVIGVGLRAMLTGVYTARLMWRRVYSSPSGAPVFFGINERGFAVSILILSLGAIRGGRIFWPTEDCSGPYFVGGAKQVLGALRGAGIALAIYVLEKGVRIPASAFWSRIGYLSALSGEVRAKVGLNIGVEIEKNVEKG